MRIERLIAKCRHEKGSRVCASIAILALSRSQARQAGIGDRADLMLLAGLVSFLPALLALVAEWVVPTALPWYIALLWLGFFPVAIGYGMIRRQLFEFRLAAKSSAAYGAATLAITGVLLSSLDKIEIDLV